MGKDPFSHICGDDERADPVEGKFFGIAEYASARAHGRMPPADVSAGLSPARNDIINDVPGKLRRYHIQ